LNKDTEDKLVQAAVDEVKSKIRFCKEIKEGTA
jgi:hypothetical protein